MRQFQSMCGYALGDIVPNSPVDNTGYMAERKESRGKGGRPTVTTPGAIAKLIEAFKLDLTVEEAVLYAGISKDTYYRKAKEDEEFSDEMERARQYATLVARQTVIREIGEDGKLALAYLERKRKAEFSPRSEVNVEGDSLTLAIQRCNKNARPVDWFSGTPLPVVSPNQRMDESLGEEENPTSCSKRPPELF